ncbi:putative Ig domain-containing protein [Tropheryma whipplei]|uniref:putative Ig domain-containing protein n=1 Tax=Tropheryma whipplei TaxID=2039 RepID=UPI0005A1D38D|nr:putative Ig domain-containing protein [Tropheryma whipplei]
MADATSGGTGATGLPKGLSIDKTSGNITGSIDGGVSQGIYTVTVTGTAPTVTSSATTLSSTTVSATYTILVTSTTPGLSSTATGVSIGQSSITITPTTQGYITSYAVTTYTHVNLVYTMDAKGVDTACLICLYWWVPDWLLMEARIFMER